MSSTTLSRANKPRYPSVAGLGLRILVSGLSMPVHPPLGSARSFREDVRPLVAGILPPLRVFGEEHIPLEGPCLLLTNHYFKPGFDAWWISMAISASVPVEVRWVITAALTYPGQKRGLIMRPLARFFLRRVARVYGFFAMPAMPPDPRQSQDRSATVRGVIAYIRQSPCPIIGLAPEGRDILEETVGWPPPGAGRFVQQIAHLGLKLAPVGVFEEDGALCLRFGPRFELEVPSALPTLELDRAISRQVMAQIARQLPSTFHFLPEEHLA